ncbi:MAG: hypothetical protein WCA85_25840 [Paraburkholderia sp.]|uniref:hypothetical protein n=1 Tax=Paraburkholderia sp. TaxID=1926495 RepID=UPI003C5B20E5
MISWFKRLIAGRELAELEMRRAVMDGWAEGLALAAAIGVPVDHLEMRLPATPPRDADMWDIAEAAERAEQPGVEYRFLGVTGEEDA